MTEALDADGNVVRAIDFDALRDDLSGDIIDGTRERYQFTWPGKREAKLEARRPTTKTLRPVKEKSVDWDTTENLYIEGDNLEVLKIMRETYAGKVKMIYIDPPYNTGNDFVYDDDYSQDHAEYDAESGDYDGEGGRLVANLESSGRFHSDWCSMMYPRLLLARDMLTTDGAIFISIDDHEQNNLIKICDEIFGRTNFVATIPWRKRTAKSDVPYGVSQDYEWIVVYAKSDQFVASVKGKERKYYESDDFPGQPWRIHDMTTQRTASERPNSFFTMVNPKTGEEYPANPNATWRVTVDTFESYYEQNRIIFPGDYDFLSIKKPVLRYWKIDDMAKAGDSFGRVAVSTKLPDDIGMSQDGTKEITSIFGTKLFNFPKPSSLIEYLINICTAHDDVVMDFFSGSGTTAQAVMQSNEADGGSRKFILCQIPEEIDENSEAGKAGFGNICDIAIRRLELASSSMSNSNDNGFRVLRVDSSNFENALQMPGQTDQGSIFDLVDNLKSNRTARDLLFQVLPKFRIPYSAKIAEARLSGKRCFVVNAGQLVACLDPEVGVDTIEAMAKMRPLYVVMRDASMANDSTFSNFEELFNTYSPDTVRRVI